MSRVFTEIVIPRSYGHSMIRSNAITVHGLVALNVDEMTYTSIVVPALLEKLPESVRLAMTRGEDFKNWKMKELLKQFLVELEFRQP